MYQSIFLQVKIEINDFVLHMLFISFTYALKTYRLINSCNFSTIPFSTFSAFTVNSTQHIFLFICSLSSYCCIVILIHLSSFRIFEVCLESILFKFSRLLIFWLFYYIKWIICSLLNFSTFHLYFLLLLQSSVRAYFTRRLKNCQLPWPKEKCKTEISHLAPINLVNAFNSRASFMPFLLHDAG